MFEIIKNEIDNTESIKIHDKIYRIGDKHGYCSIIGYRTTKNNGGGGSVKLRCICNKEFYVKGFAIARNRHKSCGCLRYDNNLEIGKKYGHGTLIERLGVIYPEEKAIYWRLQCDCGNLYERTTAELNGHSSGCGCFKYPKVNLLHKRFGSGVVIEDLGMQNLGNIRHKVNFWKLRCDCGNVYETYTGVLTSKNKQSCGCLRHADLLGKRFGKSTVIKLIGADKNNSTQWECQCDCGNVFIAISNQLTAGRVKSCGCYRRTCRSKDLLNLRFGKGVVIERIGSRPCKNPNRHRDEIYWRLKCDCGNYYESPAHSLTRKNKGIRSCGCIGLDKECKYSGPISMKQYIRQVELRALDNNIAFDIDVPFAEELLKNQNNKCQLSGMNISLDNGSASLDRIDSNSGYIKGNGQWIHRVINFMKQDLNQDDFIKYCCFIANCQKM